MDVLERLRQILDERGWTEYRLAKISGLSESTIANIFKRNTIPSLPTLEAICNGLGITLSQFFADGDMVEMTLFIRSEQELNYDDVVRFVQENPEVEEFGV